MGGSQASGAGRRDGERERGSDRLPGLSVSPSLLLSVVLRNQTKKQFFQVLLPVPLAQLRQRAFGQDVAAVQDRQLVAEPLRFAHDVRAEEDALALIAE